MVALWRHPALPVGIVLFVLGMGNWMVSRSKVIEYRHRLAGAESIETIAALSDFEHLTPRTNAALLERLHRGSGSAGVADAKLAFYTVVRSGGRLIAVVGLLLMAAGLLQTWRERRLQRARWTSAAMSIPRRGPGG